MRSMHLVWLAAAACGGGAASGTPDATTTVCGDRLIAGPEQCDDGNTLAGDGCDDACQLEPSTSCGDSIVDLISNEQCDDGNTTGGDGCDAQCRIEAPPDCGDGALDLDAGEQCDDGGNDLGDGCSATCQYEPVGAFCGDSGIDPGEVCDDGNLSNGDSCNPTCNFENLTTLFAGSPGVAASVDGVGMAARLRGGTVTADATHLWLADGMSHVLRRVEIATADVVTVAGDAVNGTAALVDDPDGLTARFNNLEAVTTDGNTVWVADSGRIRAISASPPYGVTTVAGQAPGTFLAGNGAAARFDDLRGLTYYAGKVYFVDANAAVLGSFDPATGDVVALAATAYQADCPPTATPQDGVGAAASFCSPRYMASNNSGMLYVADTNGNTVRAFNTVTGALTTFAGTGVCGYADGTGTAAAIHRPRGMTSDGTSVFWVEFNAHTIRQARLISAEVTTMIGTPAACTLTCSCPTAPVGSYLEGTGAAAVLNNPWSMTYHFPSRSLFWVDNGNAVIRRVQ